MKKKIEIGEQRTSVVVRSDDIVVHYRLVDSNNGELGAQWQIELPNSLLEVLHKALCAASSDVPKGDLTDEQRKSLAEALCPQLLVAQFTAETPETLEEGKRVDAFVNGMGIVGKANPGGLHNLTVEIPKNRPH